MNDTDRRKISDNIDKLINLTNYKVLMNECRNKGMLSPVMVEVIENFQDIKHRKLFEKIIKRGPTAFDNLLDICKRNFPEAYKILKPDSNTGVGVSLRNRVIDNNDNDRIDYGLTNLSLQDENKINNNKNTMIIEYDDHGNNLKLYTNEVKLVEHMEFKLSSDFMYHPNPRITTYPMRKRNRGVLFLVNIINFKSSPRRNGAEVDRDLMVDLFRKLDFTIFYYEDLSFHQYEKHIEELKNSRYLRRAECFVFGMLTHGLYQNGVNHIEFSDSAVYNTEEILKGFNNSRCPDLHNKPKIFLFSFCRGHEKDYGINIRRDHKTERDGAMRSKDSYINPNMPTYSDMMICYASVPGYQSLRDPDEGSWYIQAIYRVWARHAHDTHIDDLMKLVGEEVSHIRTEKNAMQTTATETRGFNNALYFNPGVWENE